MEEPRTGPIPECCGDAMVLLRWGKRANFAIWLWRCPTCERFRWTNRRYDGALFWVGAMARALDAARNELLADAYSADTPSGQL